MYHVGKFDESKFVLPQNYEQHSNGYGCINFVDHAVGSVHMRFGICQLQGGGSLEPCVHANEKGIYILQGEVDMMRGKEAFRLVADDYAVIPCGVSQVFRNTGNQAARWLEILAPQPKPPDQWQDMFFTGEINWPREMIRPEMGDPRKRLLGHFERQRPMLAHGLGIQGLTVYHFITPEFGAHHFVMMRGEMALGGTCGLHDHPFEESYLVLSGEVEMEIEGKRYHLQAGRLRLDGSGNESCLLPYGGVPLSLD